MVHVFNFTNWFMNSREDWDCDSEFMVITPGTFRFLPNVCQGDRTRMEEEFPERVEHNLSFELHRGRVKIPERTSEILSGFPDILERIVKWADR